MIINLMGECNLTPDKFTVFKKKIKDLDQYVNLKVNSRLTPGQTGPIFDNLIDKEDFYVDANCIAELLQISVHTVRKWRKQERIPYHKFGRSVRYNPTEVLVGLKKQKGTKNK